MEAVAHGANGTEQAQRGTAHIIVGDESARILIACVRDYAIYLLDVRGNVITWNQGARLIKGHEVDEVLGRHYSMFFTTEDREAAEPDRQLVAAVDAPFEVEGWR